MSKEFSFTVNPQPVTVPLNPAARAAIKSFRTAKPWTGTRAEREAKFNAFHAALNVAFGKDIGLEFALRHDSIPSDGSAYFRADNVIGLQGKLSPLVYLECYLTGLGVHRPVSAAHELARHFFPRSYGSARRAFRAARANPVTVDATAPATAPAPSTGKGHAKS